MHQLLAPSREQVAQVVEPGFLRGDVGDVGGVGAAARGGRHPFLDEGHGQAERLVDGPHPVGIAAGQIVVEGEHVHAIAAERVERRRQDRRERLALAGLHLDDGAFVHGERGDDLDVERAQAEGPARALARQRVAGGAQRRPRPAGARLLPQLARLCRQRGLRPIAQPGLERGDLSERRQVAAEIELDGRAPQPRQAIAEGDGITKWRRNELLCIP